MESRDLDALLDQSKQQSVPMESDVWRREEEQWAHYDLRTWSCGDLPERVEVSQAGALPVYAYPGLRVEDDMVHVYLFRNPEEAETETRRGIIRLGETALAEEMAWLQRDLRNLRALIDLALHAGGAERLQSMAYEHIRNALFLREKIHPLTAERFEQEIAQARELLGRFPSWFMKQIKGINEALGAAKKCPYPYPDMKRDLDRILPADFLLKTPADRLPHLTRYIRGLLIRAERARLDPVKDRIKEKKIHPFQRVCDELAQRDMKDRASFERLRWLLEEYRVSVFAQELGTAETVSPARLQSCLDDLKV
jgi:ATP-dependent helicase HrpA